MQNPDFFMLPNGLQVVYIHNLAAASLSVSITGKAGSLLERDSEAGVAHFLEHALFDGTEKYQSEESLEELLEDVGGEHNGGTSSEYATYWAKVLAKDAERAFDYVSQVVVHPLLADRSVEKHRGIIIQEVNMYESNPQRVAYQRLYGLMYPGSRLGGFITGSVEEVERITPEGLRTFFKMAYNASNFVLAISGPIGLERAQDLAQKYFSELPSRSPAQFPEVASRADFGIVSTVRKDVGQAMVGIGYPAPSISSPDRFAANVLATILGGGTLSRLFRIIREKHSLAYSVFAATDASFTHGNFVVGAGLAPENASRFVDLYREIVSEITKNLVSEKELQRAVDSIIAGFLFSAEDTSAVAGSYAYNQLFDPDTATYARRVEAFRSVTREDVQRVAQEIFAHPACVSVVAPEDLTDVFEGLR